MSEEREERAAAVFGAWRERADRGERADPEDVIRAHPELAEPLRRQFAAMRLAEGLLGSRPVRSDAAELVGRSLGPWQLTAVLGKGGMGTVFSATSGASRAAVKVMHPHLAARDGFVERFLREAEAGRRVRHANVVATLAAGTTQAGGSTVHYLVMERVEGRTLRALISDAGRLSEALCRHVGREAARALAAIHAEGFVHRDVKPENVIVTPEHVVKVMDLGVARLVDDSEGVSQTGAFVGSVRYAAPEQFARGSAGLDARADLYALGLTLYEAATGAHPFPEDDFHVVLKRQITDVPRRAGEVNPQLSPFLEELLAQLLAKDRERRPESAAAVASILDLGEDSAWWRERARAMRDETRRPLRRIRIPRETALYGRESELARLRSLFERASAGDGQVAVIEGEAGIGKSRLVDEFVGQLAASGEDVDFLFGSYPPGGAATASGAFSVAYRERIGEGETAVRAVLPQTPLLVPAFAALLRGDAVPAESQPLTKDALQTVFVHATRSLAAARPTIVLIDDLHFAPEEGRALFATLALAVPGHRVLLIGGARPTIDPTWLAQVQRLGHATRVPVSRLGAKDLVLLLRDSLKSEHLAEELSARIAVKSDGNPFFVFEILRGLREGQFITRRADGTWATTREIREIVVPSSVVELVQARVSDLSRADRNVLEAAACAGFEFDPALVAETLRIPRIAVLQSLGAIEKSYRLVRSVGRSFVFDHHQVMEVLYTGLSEPLREEYHAAIGTALETRSGAAARQPGKLDGGLCVALADHLLRGGAASRAMRYLAAALDHLERTYRHDAAVRLLDLVLGASGAVADAERCRLLVRKGARLDLLGRRDAQAAALEEATRLADASCDPALGARAWSDLGWLLIQTSRFDDARRAIDKAAALAGAAGDAGLESDAVGAMGQLQFALGRHADALPLFERRLALAKASGDRRRVSAAMGNVGTVLRNLGRSAEALAALETRIADARERGDRLDEAAAAGGASTILRSMGRFDEAGPLLERHLSLTREIGDRRGESIAIGSLGAVFATSHRFAEAVRCHEKCLSLVREIGERRNEAIVLSNLGIARMALGDAAGAGEAYSGSLALAREIGARDVEGHALIGCASVAHELGRNDVALAHLEESLRLHRAAGHAMGVVQSLQSLGDLRYDMGDVAGARAAEEEIVRLAHEHGFAVQAAWALVALARLPGGDVAAAIAAVDEVGEPAASPGTSYSLWEATGDVAYLLEAKRWVDAIAALNPEWRDSIWSGYTLNRAIAAAAEREGLPVSREPS